MKNRNEEYMNDDEIKDVIKEAITPKQPVTVDKEKKDEEEAKKMLITWFDLPNGGMLMLYKRPHADQRMKDRHITNEQVSETVRLAIPRIMRLIKNKRITLSSRIRGAISNINIVNIVNRKTLVFCSCYINWEGKGCISANLTTTYYDDGKINPDNAKLNAKTPTAVERIEVGKAGPEWRERNWVLDNYGSESGISIPYAYYMKNNKIMRGSSSNPKKEGEPTPSTDGTPQTQQQQQGKQTNPKKKKYTRKELLNMTWDNYERARAKAERDQMEKEYQEYLNTLNSEPKEGVTMVSESLVKRMVTEAIEAALKQMTD